MQIEAPARRHRLISIAPLVDIVLILLFFFMLASSYLDWRSLSLRLASGGVPLADPEQAIRVRVAVGPRIELDGQPVEPGDLARRVRSRLARSPRAPVVVAPAAGVGVQEIVGVLDSLASAGARAVSLSAR